MTNNIIAIFILVLSIIYLLRICQRAKLFVGGDSVKNLKNNPRSKSEEHVIKLLEELTGKTFPTVYPSWLKYHGRILELDGYNEDLKLAIEFSGPLHTKWFPQKEPYQKYFDRISKDQFKIKTCLKHNVELFVLDMSLPKTHWRNYLCSRLYDKKYIDYLPCNYINEQIAIVYRNPQLEKEFNLVLI